MLATEERYLEALRCFEGRVAYANVFNDLQVPYTTASIRRRNPYRQRSVQGGSPSERIVVAAAPLAADERHPRLTAWSLATSQRRLSRGVSADLSAAAAGGDGGAAADDVALEFDLRSVDADKADGIQAGFSKEGKSMQAMLREMLVSLDELEWSRYDSIFGTQVTFDDPPMIP